jgi:hypothetical protein
LRSDYKNPHTIAHKVLADRIAKRDPGNKPKPGDRLRFLFIRHKGGGGGRVLLGDRVETPEYVLQNKLPIDYNYYITNQLMKPLQQLLGLAVLPIYKHKFLTAHESKSRQLLQQLQRLEMAELKMPLKDLPRGGGEVYTQIEVFMKRREQILAKEIKKLLFEDILNRIKNTAAGNQPIRDLWKQTTPTDLSGNLLLGIGLAQKRKFVAKQSPMVLPRSMSSPSSSSSPSSVASMIASTITPPTPTQKTKAKPKTSSKPREVPTQPSLKSFLVTNKK